MFKGKQFTFMREWLRIKGLQLLGFKAWSMCTKSQLLIMSFAKKFWGGAFKLNFCGGVGGGRFPRGMLKPRIDRRINTMFV